MSNVIIGGTATGATPLPVAVSIDGANDLLPIYTASATATQAISRNTLLGVTGQPADLTTAQTLQNKTIDNTNTFNISDSLFTLADNADSTKKAQFQLSGLTTGTTRIYTLPNASVTLADTSSTQTFTNKTLTSPVISSPTITNAAITTDTVTGYTSSTTGSVYGISVTSGNISSALTLNSTLTVSGATTLSGATTVPSGVTIGTVPIYSGNGAPTFSAVQGSLYLRKDGSSTSTRLYVNTTGSTTWTNFTSAA